MKKSLIPSPIGALLLGISLAMASISHALDIQNATFDSFNSPTRPAADPDGLRLVAHSNAAALIWENLIADPDDTIAVTVRYDVNAAVGGTLNILGVTNGKASSIRLRVRPDDTWFFDPSPSANSEFAMEQTLAGPDSAASPTSPFIGSPPSVLETGWQGNAGGSALGMRDLLSALTHHLGRALGFSDTFSLANTELMDGDVDIAAGYLNGAVMALKNDAVTNPDDYNSPLKTSVLNLNNANALSRRTLPSALDLLVVARCGGWTQLRFPRVDFLATEDQFYSTGSNWLGAGNPSEPVR